MKVWPIGTVDYDHDKYKRKIRKYVVTKHVKVHGRQQVVWEQVEFKQETEMPKRKGLTS